MEAEEERSLVFTYGTLKRDFPNHHLLQSASTILISSGAVTAVPYPLVVGLKGIPFLLNLPGFVRRVSGKVYSLSTEALALIDALEGIDRGHYERLSIRLIVFACDGGEGEEKERVVMGYFAHRGFGDLMWRRCGGEKGSIGEYTAEEAKGYVRWRRGGRMSGFSMRCGGLLGKKGSEESCGVTCGRV